MHSTEQDIVKCKREKVCYVKGYNLLINILQIIILRLNLSKKIYKQRVKIYFLIFFFHFHKKNSKYHRIKIKKNHGKFVDYNDKNFNTGYIFYEIF